MIIRNANEMAEQILPDHAQIDSLKKLDVFCRTHGDVFIFGSGRIGQALSHFLVQCDIGASGHIESSSINEFKKAYIPGRVGLILGLDAGFYHEVIPLLSFMDFRDIFFVSEENKRRMVNAVTAHGFSLFVRVTYACNIQCAHCQAFSPLARKEFMDFDVFKADLLKVAYLFEGGEDERLFNSLSFSGGEPFLHPRLMEFVAFAREILPGIEMNIFTNGILLANADEQTVSRFAELNVGIKLTEYLAANRDLSGFLSLAEKYGIVGRAKLTEDADGIKTFTKEPLDLTKSVPLYEYLHCHLTMCKLINIENGKLYRCLPLAAAKNFKNYFNAPLEITADDYVDIHEAGRDDIISYLVKRPPFCSYCKVSERHTVPWRLSDRSMDEWV